MKKKKSLHRMNSHPEYTRINTETESQNYLNFFSLHLLSLFRFSFYLFSRSNQRVSVNEYKLVIKRNRFTDQLEPSCEEYTWYLHVIFWINYLYHFSLFVLISKWRLLRMSSLKKRFIHLFARNEEKMKKYDGSQLIRSCHKLWERKNLEKHIL